MTPPCCCRPATGPHLPRNVGVVCQREVAPRQRDSIRRAVLMEALARGLEQNDAAPIPVARQLAVERRQGSETRQGVAVRVRLEADVGRLADGDGRRVVLDRDRDGLAAEAVGRIPHQANTRVGTAGDLARRHRHAVGRPPAGRNRPLDCAENSTITFVYKYDYTTPRRRAETISAGRVLLRVGGMFCGHMYAIYATYVRVSASPSTPPCL
eukprot:scaffold7609_cov112-Isochrysis_galbana.AAC.2